MHPTRTVAAYFYATTADRTYEGLVTSRTISRYAYVCLRPLSTSLAYVVTLLPHPILVCVIIVCRRYAHSLATFVLVYTYCVPLHVTYTATALPCHYCVTITALSFCSTLIIVYLVLLTSLYPHIRIRVVLGTSRSHQPARIRGRYFTSSALFNRLNTTNKPPPILGFFRMFICPILSHHATLLRRKFGCASTTLELHRASSSCAPKLSSDANLAGLY